ncbi:MAG TPA: hypothetical protein VMN81_10525 [Vicinamibacterales bacterium]|nr:hypothetical protein [Vicinamibacterales bacterium]
MGRTLYEVLEETRGAAAVLRTGGDLDPEISQKLVRFEIAVEHALDTSPDKATVAHPEEVVALNALCDLHLAAQSRPESLRARLRPIVDVWIAYAASTGLTPQELAQPRPDDPAGPVDAWLRADT